MRTYIELAEMIGPYRVTDQLPRQQVYFATDTREASKVVLKRNDPTVYHGTNVADPVARSKHVLHHEFRLMNQLDHPNICKPKEYLEHTDGSDFLVLPMAGSRTLADLIKDKEYAARSALADVSSALAYMHSTQTVHRDIKPENVVVTDDSTQLIDFGTACHIVHDNGVYQKLHHGTARFMGPEQASAQKPSLEQDVFGFSALAYFTLTGDLPYVVRKNEPQFNAPKFSFERVSQYGGFGEAVIDGLSIQPLERPRMKVLAELAAKQFSSNLKINFDA